MARTVKCVLLGVEAEGLDYAPYPGELGQRIYENVSKEAWQRWLKHQTMLLNEYRLTPIDDSLKVGALDGTRAAHRRRNLLDDRVGIFAAWILRGEQGEIRSAGRGGASCAALAICPALS